MNAQFQQKVDFSRNSDQIECSIVMPVFNQEKIIFRNLKSIANTLNLKSEIIVINDASTDETEKEVLRFYREIIESEAPNIIGFKYYENKYAQFETKCDDFGIRNGNSNFVIEIQADMQILEYGFDLKLKNALNSYEDILGISGRGTERLMPIIEHYRNTLGTDRSAGHTIVHHIIRRMLYQFRYRTKKYLTTTENKAVDLVNPVGEKQEYTINDELFFSNGEAGRLGVLIQQPLASETFDARKIYLGETVMRGPLAISKEKYLEIGGFSTESFFQAFDDHDLMLRGFIEKGYRVGFVPINFESPIEDGSARKVKSIKAELQILKCIFNIRKSRRKSPLYNLRTSDFKFPNSEIRVF